MKECFFCEEYVDSDLMQIKTIDIIQIKRNGAHEKIEGSYLTNIDKFSDEKINYILENYESCKFHENIYSNLMQIKYDRSHIICDICEKELHSDDLNTHIDLFKIKKYFNDKYKDIISDLENECINGTLCHGCKVNTTFGIIGCYKSDKAYKQIFKD